MKLVKIQLVALLFLANPFVSVDRAEAQTSHRGFTVGDNVSASGINQMGSWGANVARMWCRPTNLAAVESYSAFMSRVDACISKLNSKLPAYQSAGIQVILALDPPAPIYNPSSNKPQHYMLSSNELQNWFVEGWQKIAQTYASNGQILGFDLLNEPAPPKKVPRGTMKWSALAVRLSQVIRATGASQRIYVESEFGNPVKISDVGKICKAAQKAGASGLYASFHFYSPFEFTHQGLYGRPTGVGLPNAKALKKLAKTLSAATKAKACNGVYVGEFGATRYATQRAEYFQWLVAYFESKGWDWTNHGYQEADVWSPIDANNRTDGSSSLDVLKAYFQLNP